MSTVKTILITGIVAAIGVTAYAYLKRPKATITINDTTGEGTATLGKKSGSFTKIMGISMGTWNGYKLDVDNGYTFSRNGKNIETTKAITPYDGGSSNVTINHIK